MTSRRHLTALPELGGAPRRSAGLNGADGQGVRSVASVVGHHPLGARHKRTRPRRPQTNGKSERFNRTLLDEWAYLRPYETNNERLTALPAFVDHYNNHRPHSALKGLSPMTVLVNNVSGNHT